MYMWKETRARKEQSCCVRLSRPGREAGTTVRMSHSTEGSSCEKTHTPLVQNCVLLRHSLGRACSATTQAQRVPQMPPHNTGQSPGASVEGFSHLCLVTPPTPSTHLLYGSILGQGCEVYPGQALGSAFPAVNDAGNVFLGVVVCVGAQTHTLVHFKLPNVHLNGEKENKCWVSHYNFKFCLAMGVCGQLCHI
ncbi:hypothetical protein E2C01_008815 [Portunus trituberculatus]|uniref:Uncharacterized protein n=1 Tax=Portunus trituberculatus TaxID=210409 RepID=A0A5B7D1T6_PORTR|nr:hypothetical protein [Portunus trituberculatus]